MVKRHLENEPAKEARITAFMAEWGTGRGGKQRHVGLALTLVSDGACGFAGAGMLSASAAHQFA